MKIKEIIKIIGGIASLSLSIVSMEAEKIYCRIHGWVEKDNLGRCPTCASKPLEYHWCPYCCRYITGHYFCAAHQDSPTVPDCINQFFYNGLPKSENLLIPTEGTQTQQKEALAQITEAFNKNIISIEHAQAALTTLIIYAYYMLDKSPRELSSGSIDFASRSEDIHFPSPDKFLNKLQQQFSKEFVENCRLLGCFRSRSLIDSVAKALSTKIAGLGLKIQKIGYNFLVYNPNENIIGKLFQFVYNDKEEVLETVRFSSECVDGFGQTLDLLCVSDSTLCITGNPEAFNLPSDCWVDVDKDRPELSVTLTICEILQLHPELAKKTLNDLKKNPEFDPNKSLKHFVNEERTLYELFQLHNLDPNLFVINDDHLNMSIKDFIAQGSDLSSYSLAGLSIENAPLLMFKDYKDFSGTLGEVLQYLGLCLNEQSAMELAIALKLPICYQSETSILDKKISEILEKSPGFSQRSLISVSKSNLNEEQEEIVLKFKQLISKYIVTARDAQVFASAMLIYNIYNLDLKGYFFPIPNNVQKYPLDTALKCLHHIIVQHKASQKLIKLARDLGKLDKASFRIIFETFLERLQTLKIKVVDLINMNKIYNLDGTFKGKSVCFYAGAFKNTGPNYIWAPKVITVCTQIRSLVTNQLAAKYIFFILFSKKIGPAEIISKAKAETLQEDYRLQIRNLNDEQQIAFLNCAIGNVLSSGPFNEDENRKIWKTFVKQLKKVGSNLTQDEGSGFKVKFPSRFCLSPGVSFEYTSL